MPKLGVIRRHEGETILALHNLSPESQSARLEGITAGEEIAASGARMQTESGGLSVRLEAFGYIWVHL